VEVILKRNAFYFVFVATIILFFLLFVVSCSSSNGSLNEEDARSDDIEAGDLFEEQDSEPDDEIYSCYDDWEKTDLLKDYREIYDFNIVRTEEKWEWFKDANFDSIFIEGPGNDWIGNMYVSDNGDIYLSGAFTDNREEELFRGFLNIYKKEGTLVRYSWERDRFADAYDMVFDENTGELHLALTIESDEEESSVENWPYKRRKTLIATLDKDENWHFKAWDFPGYHICFNFFKEGERFYLGCWHSSGEDLSVNDHTIQVVDDKKAYRYIDPREYPQWSQKIYKENGVLSFFAVTPGVGGPGASPPGLNIYRLDDESMCIEEEKFVRHFDIIPIDILVSGGQKIVTGHKAYSKDSIMGVLVSAHIVFEDAHTVKNISISMEDEPFYDPERGEKFPRTRLLLLTEDSDFVFATGESRFDIEDKGRVWGIVPDGVEMPNSTWMMDPILVAVDKQDVNNSYARQLLPEKGGQGVYIRNDDKYIYISGFYAPTPEHYSPENTGDMSIFIHRIPKTWIINEDARAKDTVFKVEEVSKEE
jgi:hypothetical protein